MDYIPSMFQFDQTTYDDNQHFQIISDTATNFPFKLDHHEFEDDQAPPPTPPPSHDGREHNLSHKADFGRRRRSSAVDFGGDHFCQHPQYPNHEKEKKKIAAVAFADDHELHHHQNPNHENEKNKVTHREIERQRRQEMAALYASLRSLIPLEYLKGKRSVSDQMNEAANYIKELKRKIQELRGKRDEMKKQSININNKYPNAYSSCSTSTNYIDNNNNNNNINGSDQNCQTDNNNNNSNYYNNNLESIISIRHNCRAGFEVVVNTDFRQGLSLARVLGVLTGERLNVISCVSAKVNGRFLHTIESEAVSGERSMDPSELEKKLKNLMLIK